MDSQDYFNVIYELFYNHIHLFILAIMEFYRKFLNIMENMKKKAIIKHIVNGQINQIQDIMMQYQLQKTSSTLYIGNRIILCGLSLNIIRIFRTLINVVFIGFYTETYMNEKIKFHFKNVENHTQL